MGELLEADVSPRGPAAYDVAIVGAGPAGLFAAKHLLESQDLPTRIALLDAGAVTERRRCPADELLCKDCATCAILSGVGGGGLYSDGKLILDLGAGGHVREFADLSHAEDIALVKDIEQTLLSLGARSLRAPKANIADRTRAVSMFAQRSFTLGLYDVVHLGTDNLRYVTTRLVEQLFDTARVSDHHLDLKPRTEVLRIEPLGDGFALRTQRGTIFARRVILAVGKSGAPAIRSELERLGCGAIDRPTWLGVRVEASMRATEDLFALSFDPKISRVDSDGTRVKTHCFCRDGRLLVMKYRNGYLVGGHSPDFGQVGRSPGSGSLVERRVNFNVLASSKLDQEQVDAVLARFREATGPTVAVQDLRSFLDPSRPLSDEVSGRRGGIRGEPTDIRSIFDQITGTGAAIADFLHDLGQIYPRLLSPGSVVYGPALEWDFGSVDVSAGMETTVPGLFAVGDGAGLSQGVVHAAATGIVAAAEIVAQERVERPRVAG